MASRPITPPEDRVLALQRKRRRLADVQPARTPQRHDAGDVGGRNC